MKPKNTKTINFNKLLAKHKVILAPMAGVTSFAYRKLYETYPIAFSYSEMISDLGLVYQDKKTIELLNHRIKKPYGIQIFGAKKENIISAIKTIQDLGIHYDFIDLNCACPVPKVTKNGAGSTLLKDPKYLGEIIRSVKEVSQKPITAKIRLGYYDHDLNFAKVIEELKASGVSLIAIHARSAKQLYSGLPNFEILKNIGLNSNIPIVISGNIFSAKEAVSAMEITKAQGVMVARGGMGNPNLITAIDQSIKRGKIVEPKNKLKKQAALSLKYLKLLIKEKGEERAIAIFKGIGPKFFLNLPNSKDIRKEITLSISSFKEYQNLLKRIRKNK